MDLFSIGFVSFIAVFLILYYVLPKRFQPVILLLANILFYLVAGKWNLIFIMVTALTVWAGALKIGSFSNEYKDKRKEAGSDKEEKKRLKEKYLRKKRIVLALVLLINFGILAYMKYFRVLAGFKGGLLLPLGISFYTFQAAGYLIDVYGGKYDPEKRFPDFLLFVSFFPQLIQGPINRYDALKEQFKKDHVLTSEKVKNAVFLILYGLMKKYAVANMLSDSIEAVIGGDTASMPGSLIVFSILMYSAEQYADFSGGIDIVLGVAKLFDIEMMPNFRQPYFSTSLEDFWRRWHISLGAWMRDYVFYPFALLKFNQKAGKWSSEHINKHFGRVLPAAISNIVVFFLVGIWHGAYLHYVLWGLYNGIIIALADMLSPVFQSLNKALHIPEKSVPMHVFRVIRTFIIVNIGWYFDRIEDVGKCISCLERSVSDFSPGAFRDAINIVILNSNSQSPLYALGGMCLAAVGIVVIFTISFIREKGITIGKRNGVGYNILYGSTVTVLSLMLLFSFIFMRSAGGFMYANF